MTAHKTLGMKLLEGKRVAYEARPYPPTTRDAEEVAAAIGADPMTVYKSLIVLPPGSSGPLARPILVMLPAPAQLNLKKLAKAVQVKKVKMASHQEAEALTGLQVGGISPLALLNKGFTMFIDRNARDQEQIYLSAGERGLQVRVAVNDLLKIIRAKWVDAAQYNGE